MIQTPFGDIHGIDDEFVTWEDVKKLFKAIVEGKITEVRFREDNTKYQIANVVRCKDCKYGVKAKNGLKQDVIECNNSDLSMMGDCHFPNWYCADGEPKDGEQDG